MSDGSRRPPVWALMSRCNGETAQRTWSDMMTTTLELPTDTRDRMLRAEKIGAWDMKPGPRVGDYVIFADGVTRRISHDWGDEVQTSSGGSWYLGKGFMSFSGQLYGCVPVDTLERVPGREGSEGMREGSCWFFHNDIPRAHSGVETYAWCRVFRCSLPAPA